MIAIISLFYGSLVAIVIMVGIKFYEASKGRMLSVTRFARSVDHVFEGWYSHVRKFMSHISWHNMYVGFWWAVRWVFRTLHISYKYVEQKAANDPRSRRIIDMVKGKHIPQRNAGASLYLKRIKPERPM